MIWLWILGILAALILLLCLTRVGARAELRRDGVTLDAKIGPFHIRILPAKEKPEKVRLYRAFWRSRPDSNRGPSA